MAEKKGGGSRPAQRKAAATPRQQAPGRAPSGRAGQGPDGRRGAGADLPAVDGWFRPSREVRDGFASGNSFELKPVRYAVIGEMAIFEGDIALGTVAQLERVAGVVSDSGVLPLSGIAISGDRFRWPGGVVPYVIDPGLAEPQRVLDAIAHWEARTAIRLVPREAGNPAHQNYVSFEQRDGCWSEVGMRGGKQVVSLGVGCGVGQAIHEIGHVVGLWHEHSRQDRDLNVEVLWENIRSGMEHNFTQHIADGDDIGPYDYGSIMHYPALAFSANGQPTIVPRQGTPIGQREGLSDSDVAAVAAMYPDGGGGRPVPPQPVPTGPPLVASGSEVLGSVPPLDYRRWITADWPVEAKVVWTVVPSPVSARVEWSVAVERQDEARLRYYIVVRNLGEVAATVEARYSVL